MLTRISTSLSIPSDEETAHKLKADISNSIVNNLRGSGIDQILRMNDPIYYFLYSTITSIFSRFSVSIANFKYNHHKFEIIFDISIQRHLPEIQSILVDLRFAERLTKALGKFVPEDVVLTYLVIKPSRRFAEQIYVYHLAK